MWQTVNNLNASIWILKKITIILAPSAFRSKKKCLGISVNREKQEAQDPIPAQFPKDTDKKYSGDDDNEIFPKFSLLLVKDKWNWRIKNYIFTLLRIVYWQRLKSNITKAKDML